MGQLACRRDALSRLPIERREQFVEIRNVKSE